MHARRSTLLATAALAVAGCGSSSHAPTATTAAATPPSGLAGCLLAWNSGASAADHRALAAGLTQVNPDADVEQWPQATTTASTARGSVTVATGDCVIGNRRGVAFARHAGAWVALAPLSPSDPLSVLATNARDLPNVSVSADGLAASASEPGP